MVRLSTLPGLRTLRLLALATALAATPAWADAPAAAATTAARQHAASRAEAVSSLEVSRTALAARGEVLAAEIARLKSAGARPLLPGVPGSLDELLKQAQALAGQLAQLDRQSEQARREAEQAQRELLGTLDVEIAGIRAEMAQGGEAERRVRFARLRTLVDERAHTAGIIASVPAAARAVELPAVDPRGQSSGDLQDLADETRDQSEKVLHQLDQVDQRLAALQARRRLLRSSSAFSRDQSLFVEDERVRRVRVERGSYAGGLDARGTGTGRPAAPTPSGAASGPVAPAAQGGAAAESTAVAERGDEAPMENGAPPPGAPADADGTDGNYGAGEGSGVLSGGSSQDPAPLPPPTPVGVPGGVDVNVGGAVSVQPAVMIQENVDFQLLNGDVGNLGPDALAEQIRQLRTRRQALEKTADLLDQRQRALEAGKEGAE